MMRIIGVTLLLGSMLGITSVLQAQNKTPPQAPTSPNYPAWAYGIPDTGTPRPRAVDDGTLLTLPGSSFSFTASKARGRLDSDLSVRVAPADWFPEDHPTMPKIVAEGDSTRGIVACSLCHLPNGKGRPENAPPMGQSREYTFMTLMDMKNGLRASGDPRKGNANSMNKFAKAMTEQEIEEVAAYYASMKWTPWITVKETNQIPRMYIRSGLWLPEDGAAAGTESIGMRVVETPENVEHAQTLRSPRSGFIAYVPVGSVAKGKNIVTTGDNGKTTACTLCHGPDLHGVGSIPSIAARSPSYIARQLFSYQSGDRDGTMASLMKPVVAKLTNEDFVNITAYLASLPAQAQTPTFTTE
ncbi:MAG: c-type cytochrome [Gammaproteobacteria bacterium]|jgi:cytochrome c553